jgi:hypothetical protein
MHFDYSGYNPKKNTAEKYFLNEPSRMDNIQPTGPTDSKANKQDNILQLNENINTERVQLPQVSVTDREEIKPPVKIAQRTISLADYEALNPEELLQFDRRSNSQYFQDLLILEHSLVSLILKRSLRDPLFLRLFKCIFFLSIVLAASAVSISDTFINMNQSDPDNVNKPLYSLKLTTFQKYIKYH